MQALIREVRRPKSFGPADRPKIEFQPNKVRFVTSLLVLLLFSVVTVTGSQPAAATAMTSTASSCPTAAAFTDVGAGAWYATPVQWAACNQITTGTSATTFSPNSPVTKAQMATFMWRHAGEPSSTFREPFADVADGAWYSTPVKWMLEEEIITSAPRFGPNNGINRATLAIYLWRLAGEPRPVTPAPFTDVRTTDTYSDAVRWLVDAGITNGTGNSKFSPLGAVTRAQAVTFLHRLDKSGTVCLGKPVDFKLGSGGSILDKKVIFGTDGPDTIRAPWGARVCGRGGNDTITINGYGAIVHGGDGDDTIRWISESANAIAFGGTGNDRLYGSRIANVMHGGTGNDYFLAGQGRDILHGGPGHDYMVGGGNEDTIHGGTGNDTLNGGPGNDVILAGAGNDTLYGGGGSDTLDGGAGNDRIFGSTHTLNPSDAPDTIRGGAGNDTIQGGLGRDVVDGGPGTDSCADDRRVATGCEVYPDTQPPSTPQIRVGAGDGYVGLQWSVATDNTAVTSYDVFISAAGDPVPDKATITYNVSELDSFDDPGGGTWYHKSIPRYNPGNTVFDVSVVAVDEQGNTSSSQPSSTAAALVPVPDCDIAENPNCPSWLPGSGLSAKAYAYWFSIAWGTPQDADEFELTMTRRSDGHTEVRRQSVTDPWNLEIGSFDGALPDDPMGYDITIAVINEHGRGEIMRPDFAIGTLGELVPIVLDTGVRPVAAPAQSTDALDGRPVSHRRFTSNKLLALRRSFHPHEYACGSTPAGTDSWCGWLRAFDTPAAVCEQHAVTIGFELEHERKVPGGNLWWGASIPLGVLLSGRPTYDHNRAVVVMDSETEVCRNRSGTGADPLTVTPELNSCLSTADFVFNDGEVVDNLDVLEPASSVSLVDNGTTNDHNKIIERYCAIGNINELGLEGNLGGDFGGAGASGSVTFGLDSALKVTTRYHLADSGRIDVKVLAEATENANVVVDRPFVTPRG